MRYLRGSWRERGKWESNCSNRIDSRANCFGINYYFGIKPRATESRTPLRKLIDSVAQ